ncbi:hypothetical protein [Streptomyces liangshanensis]|uniref:Large membrane protein n=1 Tax=Streptomyces liangshanensis TaxID=2717324 RepID=A0A6G9H3U4_9ACTN|nr:hypothetical protein [Streptomyces liangshanensis]QIQ05150.1 hypothetical protein HA039_25300 [Streptomyces liangshanensis]
MTSTEPGRSTDPDSPRRRRSPLALATVVAVLIAGGGGLYLAGATPGSGGGDGARTVGDPPPLVLDSAARAADPSAPPPGIAPGEPDPNGVTYRAGGELPEGPDSAPVYRTSGTVSAAEVARLAAALGVPGAPRADGTAWEVGTDQDGSGPLLRVEKQAPGTWTFARFGPSPGGDNCLKGKSCPSGDIASGEGPAVSEAAARKAAAPVIEALGQDDAKLDARQVMGAVRVVNADPVVGGLPTYGWSTGIQVGADGTVTGGSGQLKAPERARDYPVVGADEALAELNRAAAGTPSSGIGGCATAEPLKGGGEAKPAAPCEPGTAPTAPEPLVVDRAVFGLALEAEGGKPALVPAWLFRVAPGGGAEPYTVTRTAVAPKFVEAPPAPSLPPHREAPGGGGTGAVGPGAVEGDGGGGTIRPVISYTSDGTTLTMRFWAGVCGSYAARAEEGGRDVKVTVYQADPDPDRVCVSMAKEQTASVTLKAPLRERGVVNATTGASVPRG